MKAIVNTAPHRIEMLDYPTPEAGPGQVRIRTGACGICATDLEMIAGWDRTGFPAICGHEWSGTVDAVGQGVDETLPGKKCVAENVLSDGGEVGFEHPGGYAQFFLTEAKNIHLLPEGFSFAHATLIEPLAVCVRAMNRLRRDFGEPVMVFGDGPIGLLMVRLLNEKGVKDITIVGGRDERLQLATEFGALRSLNYHQYDQDLAPAIFDVVGGAVATVIEAAGSSAAMGAAMETVAPAGRILVLGEYGDARADFLWNRLLIHEIELIGSNASAGAWPEAVRSATNSDSPLHRMITHRLPAEQFAKGIEMLHNRHKGVIKVVLEWD